MDLYFQGLSWFNKGRTPANVAQAHRFLDRALAADPDNVDALVQSARAYVVEGALSCGLRGGRGEADQSLIVRRGPCACPHVVGVCPHTDQARSRGHRRM